MFNRKYKSEYEVEEKGKKKVLIYMGEYYSIQAESWKIQRFRLLYGITMLCLIAFFLIGGLLNNDGSRVFYVVVPYVCSTIPLFYMTLATFRFLRLPLKFQHIHYDLSVTRLKKTSVVLIALSVMTMLGDLIYFFIQFDQIKKGKEIIFFCIAAAIFGLTFFYRKLQDQVLIIKESNHENDK